MYIDGRVLVKHIPPIETREVMRQQVQSVHMALSLLNSIFSK